MLRGPLVLGALGLSSIAALHLRDPHSAGSWGKCPFLAITGQPCPGCGGLRAVNDLTNGDIAGALGSNAVAVAAVGVLGVAWLVWLIRRARGRDVPLLRIRSWMGVAIVAVIIVFAVFRLTPWGAALRP